MDGCGKNYPAPERRNDGDRQRVGADDPFTPRSINLGRSYYINNILAIPPGVSLAEYIYIKYSVSVAATHI